MQILTRYDFKEYKQRTLSDVTSVKRILGQFFTYFYVDFNMDSWSSPAFRQVKTICCVKTVNGL